MGFAGRSITSIRDLSKGEILQVLDLAREMVPAARGQKQNQKLAGKILGTLFFEPSTRTRLSFESAMKRLGGSCLGFADSSATSTSKGETLSDTIRMAMSYADALVVRHPKEGAARLAAEVSKVPVINAGDGAGQHPTQTLLDLFTIREEKGKIEGNTILLLGDLKYGRTVHSLAYALASFGADLVCISPKGLEMPKEVVKRVTAAGGKVRESAKLADHIKEADVLYVTRIQKERFPDPEEYRKMVGTYRVDLALLKEAKKDLIVMHPLPRVDEVAPEVDGSPHARYFQQAFNAVPVRMAILSLILGGDS